jgi:hypothetical protein
MKNCLNKELAHFLYSGRVFVALAVFVLIFIGGEVLNYRSVENNIEILQMNYESSQGHIEKDEWEKHIYEDFEYIPVKNGVTFKNSVGYFWHLIGQKKYASSPQYAFMQSLEFIISLAPILFTLTGAMYGGLDFRFGVNKTKVSRDGKSKSFFAKQIVMTGEALGLCVVAILTALIASVFTYRSAAKAVSVFPYSDTFVPEQITMMPLCILIAMLVVFLFLETGFCLAFVFKNIAIPVIFVILYWYACPPLGKFEPRNLISALTEKHFPFYGIVVNNGSYEINLLLSAVILSLCTAGFFALSFVISKKRSAY